MASGWRATCMFVHVRGGRSDKGLCGNKVRARGGNSPRRPPLASHTHRLSVFHGYNYGQYTNFVCIAVDISQHNIVIVTRFLWLSSTHKEITFTLTDFYTQTHGGTDTYRQSYHPTGSPSLTPQPNRTMSPVKSASGESWKAAFPKKQ